MVHNSGFRDLYAWIRRVNNIDAVLCPSVRTALADIGKYSVCSHVYADNAALIMDVFIPCHHWTVGFIIITPPPPPPHYITSLDFFSILSNKRVSETKRCIALLSGHFCFSISGSDLNTFVHLADSFIQNDAQRRNIFSFQTYSVHPTLIWTDKSHVTLHWYDR